MFTNLFGRPQPQQFGVELSTGNRGLASELHQAGTELKTTSKKVRQALGDYKNYQELYKITSRSYYANLSAMLDVSKMLNDYASFFNILREEISKTTGVLGTLQPTDIEYLENLTKEKMAQFSQSFITETNKVKGIYQKFGQNDELSRIQSAQEAMQSTNDAASLTLGALRASRQEYQNGQGNQGGGWFWTSKPSSSKTSKTSKSVKKTVKKSTTVKPKAKSTVKVAMPKPKRSNK